MIQTHVYRCPEGCCRQSAADLSKFKCHPHELAYALVPDSRLDVRLSSDPPGTPLFRKP